MWFSYEINAKDDARDYPACVHGMQTVFIMYSRFTVTVQRHRESEEEKAWTLEPWSQSWFMSYFTEIFNVITVTALTDKPHGSNVTFIYTQTYILAYHYSKSNTLNRD